MAWHKREVVYSLQPQNYPEINSAGKIIQKF